mmetsp:Transcript_21250/g.50387  ORF Transcript_21250/g.50387 Transcript_21250/m.50387 type:complete len:204 (+) Transcript_21250:171-782(+)
MSSEFSRFICEATDMSMYLSPKVTVIPAIRLGSSLVSTVTLPVPPVIALRAPTTSSTCAFSSGSALVITAVSSPLAADRSWPYMSMTFLISLMRPPSASADRAFFVLSHAPASVHRLATPATFLLREIEGSITKLRSAALVAIVSLKSFRSASTSSSSDLFAAAAYRALVYRPAMPYILIGATFGRAAVLILLSAPPVGPRAA